MLRRLAALALSIPLLHLNVARADAACGSHDAQGSARAVPDAPAMEHHAHHAAPADTVPAGGEKQCDAPQARDCCASLASCAASFDTNAAETDDGWPVASDAIATRPLSAPALIADAPEPPPPRA